MTIITKVVNVKGVEKVVVCFASGKDVLEIEPLMCCKQKDGSFHMPLAKESFPALIKWLVNHVL